MARLNHIHHNKPYEMESKVPSNDNNTKLVIELL